MKKSPMKKKDMPKKDHKPKKGDPKAYPRGKKAEAKEEKVMHEWKEGELHSGSKKGPKVTNQKQAVAIAISEARKAKKKK